ncbi:hypothetical protein CPC08DRAFT_296645 [Agrocybe pediades]|nr:hypothetical protein CPC08DRAFT_296645 [Agrocybe pediades]
MNRSTSLLGDIPEGWDEIVGSQNTIRWDGDPHCMSEYVLRVLPSVPPQCRRHCNLWHNVAYTPTATTVHHYPTTTTSSTQTARTDDHHDEAYNHLSFPEMCGGQDRRTPLQRVHRARLGSTYHSWNTWVALPQLNT